MAFDTLQVKAVEGLLSFKNELDDNIIVSATHMLLLASNRMSNMHLVLEKLFSFNVTFVKS